MLESDHDNDDDDDAVEEEDTNDGAMEEDSVRCTHHCPNAASGYFDGTTPSCWIRQRHRQAVLPVGVLRVIRDTQPVQMLLLTPQEGLAEEQT